MASQYIRENAGLPGTAAAHTLAGEPLTHIVRQNAAAEGVQQAGLLSTLPYVPPEQRRRTRCAAKDGTCKGMRMKDLEYCVGHARSMGLIKNWNKQGPKDD